MIIGDTLHRGDGETSSIYYSQWFPSQGNAVQVVCDVISSYANLAAPMPLTFKIDIETKKSEESDKGKINVTNGGIKTITLGTNKQTSFEGGALLNSDQWNTAGLTGQEGLRDLVRFRYELVEGDKGNDFVHFRMLVGAWLSN